MGKLIHIDADGNPKMVDISDKKVTERVAVAESRVLVNDKILRLLNNDDITTKKVPTFIPAL